MNYKKELLLAKQVAVKAGRLLLKNFRINRSIYFKGNKSNLVTDMDRASEEFIVNHIKKVFPHYEIIAEEGQHSKPFALGSLLYRWHIDPLDGTTNYAHGFPVFCVSIGLEYEGKIVMGVVYNPNLDELFYAVEGGGAYKTTAAGRNIKRLAVSQTRKLDECLLATGFPYDLKVSKDNNVDYFNAFIMHARAIRRAGSAALDLCYVAAGIFDGFWEIKLGSWDLAAGSLIASEAGAKVTDIKGGKLDIYKGEVVASNGRIHRQMLDVIKRA